MYLTAQQLVNRLGAEELTRLVAARFRDELLQEVFVATLSEADLTGFYPHLVVTATAAAEFVQNELHDAANVINGYLAANGRYSLPLPQDTIDASPLVSICYDLVRYKLMRAADEQTTRDYDLAMAKLRDISKGIISLGPQDTAKTASPANIRIGHSTSRWPLEGFGR